MADIMLRHSQRNVTYTRRVIRGVSLNLHIPLAEEVLGLPHSGCTVSRALVMPVSNLALFGKKPDSAFKTLKVVFRCLPPYVTERYLTLTYYGIACFGKS